MTNVSLSEANCMEYFMTFPWKMLQDIPRGFQGNFYSYFLLHQRFTESCGKQGWLVMGISFCWLMEEPKAQTEL